MSKDEVVKVLQIILDSLTSGKSAEDEVAKTKEFFEKEFAKVNKENAFYQRIIRLCLINELYVSSMVYSQSEITSLLSGADCFNRQMKSFKEFDSKVGNNIPSIDFDSFIKSYLEAAENDPIMKIHKETKYI